MKNNAAMHPHPADVSPGERNERVKDANPGPAVQPVPCDTASAGAPERTVLRELHRMFALIAIR